MRLKVIRVSQSFLVDILAGRMTPFDVDPKLPDDLRIVDILREYYPDAVYNVFELIVESDSFDVVPEGGAIPRLELVCKHKVIQ